LRTIKRVLIPFQQRRTLQIVSQSAGPFNCWGFVQLVLAAKPANIPQPVLLPS